MKNFFSLFFLILACSTAESVLENELKNEYPNSDTSGVEENRAIKTKLKTNALISKSDEYLYLSSLSDTYLNRQNIVPEAFSRIKSEIEVEKIDLFEGFRIQIFSGHNPALADTAAKRFRTWSASNIDGYQAETYTFFKAPYYRVHIGDFHNRSRAIEFSNLIKKRFRDSWVVYDRVNPYNVLADTTFVSLNK